MMQLQQKDFWDFARGARGVSQNRNREEHEFDDDKKAKFVTPALVSGHGAMVGYGRIARRGHGFIRHTIRG